MHLYLFRLRIRNALKASGIHAALSAFVASCAAILVLGIWYPWPYSELSGGQELFLLVVAVDVVCGPVLTAVLYNPQKPRVELIRDLTLVGVVQLIALVYGIWTVWQVRPLYLVHEVDRFKVISAQAVPAAELLALPETLQIGFFSGPLIVGLRAPKDVNEKNTVMFESVGGGRDYGERPDFYTPYSIATGSTAFGRGLDLTKFLNKYPEQTKNAMAIADKHNLTISGLRCVPVIGRQEWVAVLNKSGAIVGFLKGDGF